MGIFFSPDVFRLSILAASVFGEVSIRRKPFFSAQRWLRFCSCARVLSIVRVLDGFETGLRWPRPPSDDGGDPPRCPFSSTGAPVRRMMVCVPGACRGERDVCSCGAGRSVGGPRRCMAGRSVGGAAASNTRGCPGETLFARRARAAATAVVGTPPSHVCCIFHVVRRGIFSRSATWPFLTFVWQGGTASV